MAVGTPTSHGAENTSNSDKTLHNTAAFTPVAGTLVFAACAARKTASGTPAPILTIGETHAGAWVWQSLVISNTESNRHVFIVSWAICPATPGSGQVQWSSNLDCNRWEAFVGFVTGAADTITNSGNNETATATSSVSLTSTPAASSVVIGFIASVGDLNGVVPGAGWTELFDSQNPVPPGGDTLTTLGVIYDMTPTATAASWTDCATSSNLMIVIEVPVEAVATTLGPLSRRRRIRGGGSKDARFLRR